MTQRQPLVIGVGNSLMADDGAGPYTVSLLTGRLPESSLRVLATPAFSLLTFIHDRSKVIVVDAAQFGGAAGEVRRVDAASITRPAPQGPLSLHDKGVADVFSLALSLDMAPQELVVYCIQTMYVGARQGLSPEVEAGCRVAADSIEKELTRA